MLMGLGFVIDAMVFARLALVSTTASPAKQVLLIVATATVHAQQAHTLRKQPKLASLANHLALNALPLLPIVRNARITFCHI